jgi:pseudouridine kinase
MCGFKIKTDEDIRKAGKYFVDLGIKNVFITLDEDGIYYNNGVEEGKLKANDAKVINVTGAGDSFVAGIAHGYMESLSLIDTLKFAISMSTITISTEETIHPELSYDLVKEYVDNIRWTHTKYNK